MDKLEFERTLMTYLEKESLVLTAVNVAFALGLDTKDAAMHMAALAADGKLEIVGGTGVDTSYRVKGKSFVTTTPGTVSVTKARSSQAFYHALANLIPGLGSLIYMKPVGFIPVLLLISGAIAMVVLFPSWSKFFAFAPLPIAWLWSIVYGIVLYAKDPWSTPKQP